MTAEPSADKDQKEFNPQTQLSGELKLTKDDKKLFAGMHISVGADEDHKINEGSGDDGGSPEAKLLASAPKQKESPEQIIMRVIDEAKPCVKAKIMVLINNSDDMKLAGISFREGLSLKKEGAWKKELERIFEEAKTKNVLKKLMDLFKPGQRTT